MNLKEKAKEAKEYGEIKDQLIKLIDEFLIKYKEYENTYKNIFTEWMNKIIAEFTCVFESEGFEVTTKVSNYSNMDSNYKTVRAVLYDLEFELLITINEYQEIRFLQIKPETEAKNIIIKPTIQKYYIKSLDAQKIKISNLYSLEEKKKQVKDAKFSIEEMNEFILAIKKEIEILLDELKKVESTPMKSIAIPVEKFGFQNKDASYGEFEKLNELIEKI